MSCRMKIEQLREAVALGVQEKKSGGCRSGAHPPLPPCPHTPQSNSLFLSSDKDRLQRSQEECQRLQRRASRHQEKRDKIERHNRRLGELLERRSRELQVRLDQLGALRREHIVELSTHIFPTQEDKQGGR